MADDELKDELKEFELDIRAKGKNITIGRNELGGIYLLDTRGPCGTPNPNPPPTHILVNFTQFEKVEIAADKDGVEFTPEL
jgi:hypothetical protein